MIRDALIFKSTPSIGIPTIKTTIPFTLSLSSGTVGTHVIDLYAENSRSRPYQNPQNKWGHLLPQWHFEDLDGNIISNIKTTDTTITSSGEIVGTVGTAQFYYVDDMPSELNSPVLLWATLQTSGIPVSYDNEKQDVPGYSNSEIMAVFPYVINPVNPTHLAITRNGIEDINELKWATVEFPYVVTLQGEIPSVCNRSEADSVIVFDYPESNTIGSQYLINRRINGVPQSSQTWNPLSAYFQRYDGDYYVGGFQRGSVVSDLSSLNTTISANTIVEYTTAFQDIPFVWVANPDNRTINKITYFSVSSTANDYFPQYIPASIEQYGIPYVTAAPTPMSLTGFGGIFGIAMNQCGDAWMTDVELGKVYKYDVVGNLLSSIDINTVLNATSAEYYTPAGVALDSNDNVWISIYDSTYIIKYDGTTYTLVQPTSFTDGTNEDPSMLPVQVDTDTEDNIWTSYNYPSSGKLIKYDNNGSELIVVDLDPVSACPVDLVVDGSDNSLWVANCHLYQAVSGTVQKYDSAGVLQESYDAARPTFITLDRNGSPWFTYGYNNVGFISGGSLTGFSLSATQVFAADNSVTTESILGGIAADSKNRIWAIDSVANVAYVFPATDSTAAISSEIATFKIQPDQNLSWYVSGGKILTKVDPNAESAQAFSDWTGYRWKSKYQPYSSITTTITSAITGQSNVFDIKAFENENVIRRYNESWDAGLQMQSYALPEHINDKTALFIDFLRNAVGNTRDDEQELGQQYYEKIANFVNNHSDITEANVDFIYSLAQETDVPIDNYNFDYPPALKRIIDIISINQRELWGTRCKCNRNFDRKTPCSNCNHKHGSNLGDRFESSTYVVTADEKFVVKYRFGAENYYLLTPGPLSGSLVYPLSTAPNIEWLERDEYIQYNFFTHIPTYCNTQVEGVINWEDPYTTLSENNSALSAWYGDNGIIEEMINYTLHEGLGLNNG